MPGTRSHTDFCYWYLYNSVPIYNSWGYGWGYSWGYTFALFWRFLTAKRRDEDVAEGFKVGGDGYMTKPFSMPELVLRIGVFSRRMRSRDMDKTEIFKIGSLTFHYSELQLVDAEGRIQPYLSQKEADLLRFLSQNANRIIKRQEILFHVWGKDDWFMGRSMDVFMSKLRKRFSKEPGVELITYHGQGFKFEISEQDNRKLIG